ncbi:MAG TPA: outer membrane beta-barrel protein, partial [Candidatus Polarisedimenticolia bacterium]|nr:outer membrane beta-barrel protein [Candidatus Polarisedimenticolia bacterium]
SIPVYFPMSSFDPNGPHPAERYDDVTGFINRVFQDPTSFRNRGNQINIDQFTMSASVNYNFNTKADSRIVPYVKAGFGRWIRNFDEPWDGDDTNFLTYGGGVRFFVNEIFAFRAEVRNVHYLDDSFTIKAKLNGVDLKDRQFEGSAVPVCERDQRLVTPPCEPHNVPSTVVFPDLGGGGGNASVQVVADLDDFYEVRIGFDVVLGGK